MLYVIEIIIENNNKCFYCKDYIDHVCPTTDNRGVSCKIVLLNSIKGAFKDNVVFKCFLCLYEEERNKLLILSN